MLFFYLTHTLSFNICYIINKFVINDIYTLQTFEINKVGDSKT